MRGRDRRLHHHARGLLLARGRSADAERELRAAVFSPTGGYTRVNHDLGDLLVRLGRPRDAIAVLEPVLRGGIDGSNAYVTHAEVHELLARAWSDAGEPARALPHLRYVVTAWRRADPAYAPRRRAAERALARVSGGR